MATQRSTPTVAPFNLPISAAAIHDIWDTYITPTQNGDVTQSVETRTLIGVLRWAHQEIGTCTTCATKKEKTNG